MGLTLRDYQQSSVDAIRTAFRDGCNAPLLASPTGSGKTVIFAHIANGAAAKGKRILILVHRRELLSQCSRALDDLGVHHGLISPQYKHTTDAVQVASVQTLVRRLHREPEPALIIIDEAHHGVAGSWSKILAAYPNAKVLGVTATPARHDGRGLGDVFDRLILGPSVPDLIARGYLTRPVVYAPAAKVDITSIRHKAGDFDAAASAALLDKASITGDCVAHYRRLCDGKPAIAFCATVAHAHHVAESFRAAGFKAAALDGTTDDAPRRGMIRDLGTGGLNVLTSCDVVSEGTDIAAVFGAILLRPTESTGLYLQQVGRVLRPYPGKTYSVIADHVGNCLRHGMPDDMREWSLDGEKQGRKSDTERVQRHKMCQKCYAMNPVWQQTCEQCGAVFEPQRDAAPEQVDGELVEVTPEQREALRVQARRQQGAAKTREELEAIAKQRGYAKGWVDYVLRAREKNKHRGPVGSHISIKEMKGEVA